MSSATACPRFVQNAWKRDLCSHCFKPKEDHLPVQPPPAPTIFFTSKQPAQSILKNGVSSSRKSNCVHFPAEESQVIGYGGDECYSDPEDDVSPVSLSIAAPDDDDDEAWKVLQRLTQANTQFNAVTSNLSAETVDSVEAPAKQRTYTHLQLGRTPTDDRGNKRTLQVSVTPFGGANGEDSNPTTRINGFRKVIVKEEENIESDKTISKIPVNKSRSIYRAPAFNGRSDLENRAENEVIIPRIKSLRPSISNNENEVKANVSISPQNTKETETSPSPEELPKEDGEVIEAPIVECKPKVINDSLEDLPPIEPPVVKSESSIVLTKRIQPPVKESDENEKNNQICESRELAGEPDGRADDTTLIEPPPPALPSSPPPPLDPRPSFLHGLVSGPAINKPKVPIKPAHVLSGRPPPLSITTSASILLSTSPPVTNIITNTIPSEILLPTSTAVTTPPTATTTTTTTTSETPSLLCSLPDVAQSAILLSSSCSKSESENAERSCSSRPTSPETARALKRQAPRPPAEEPRRSLSAESLTCTTMASSSASATTISNVADNTGKKKKSHGHFSLRKLLRFGSKESTQNGSSDNKTGSAVNGATNSTTLSNGGMLSPKPRPEIIHPLDLMNASPVQVVASATLTNKPSELEAQVQQA